MAQISIHDRGRYDRYVSQFMPVLSPFDGRLLAADEAPAVQISKDRIAATTGCVLLVSGI